MKGYYKGKGIASTLALGKTNANNPRIGLAFEVIAPDQEEDGFRVTWYGNFGDEVRKNNKTSTEMVFEALTAAGWKGPDITNAIGIGDVEVELVLDEEENEETGKMYTVVRWVNRQSGPSFKKPLEGAELVKFANDMKAKAILFAQKKGGGTSAPKPATNGAGGHPYAPGNSTSDDIPF